MQKRSLKIVGILGDPIDHSRSPVMQNAAFRAAGLPFLYLPFHVRPGELGKFIREARRLRLAGLNVTIPHKEAVVRHLDRLTPTARKIGAVNTILIKGGSWIGENTDAVGYLTSLIKERGFRPRGRTVTILGAGGAARAVAVGLLEAGARRVNVVNRTKVRAERLIRDLRRLFPSREGRALPLQRLKQVFPETDLFINATPNRHQSLPLRLLPRHALVSDLIYEETPLLRQARKRGLKTLNGLGMLLYQGAEGFWLWTGRRPDLSVMRRALVP